MGWVKKFNNKGKKVTYLDKHPFKIVFKKSKYESKSRIWEKIQNKLLYISH